MVYLLTEVEALGRLYLVKAKTKEELEARLKLPDDIRVMSLLTDNELHVLEASQFAMIQS